MSASVQSFSPQLCSEHSSPNLKIRLDVFKPKGKLELISRDQDDAMIYGRMRRAYGAQLDRQEVVDLLDGDASMIHRTMDQCISEARAVLLPVAAFLFLYDCVQYIIKERKMAVGMLEHGKEILERIADEAGSGRVFNRFERKLVQQLMRRLQESETENVQ